MNFCPYCGAKTVEGSDVCLSCGRLLSQNKSVKTTKVEPINTKGRASGIVSIVFGSLGFYPLIFIGSIVGFITGLVSMSNKDSKYRKLGTIGFWLSIGSFAFWLFIFVMFFLMYDEIDFSDFYNYYY